MPIDHDAEPRRLRAALRDLVALSAIPAAWVGREPRHIAAGLADVVIGSLQLDFAFVRLCDAKGGTAVEVTLGSSWQNFPEWLKRRLVVDGPLSDKQIVVDAGGGAERCSGIVIPIGINAEGGLVAAACGRSDFPTELDQLLLSVAANHAATAFQSARLVHQRRCAEEALRESEQQWRSLTEALPQLVWTATPDGACNYFSSQWTEYTGISQDALLDWRWMEVLHPDDREPTRQFWLDSVAGRHPYDVEYRVRRRDGVYGWFKTRGVPIRDGAENIVKWFGSCTDISDLKRLENELREARAGLETKVVERTAELRRSEAHLADAQRLSHSSSWAWNVATKQIVHWSQEAYPLYGFDPEEGIPPFDALLQRFHPEDRGKFVEHLEAAIRDRTDFEVDHRILLPQGTIKHIHSVGHPVFNASGDLVEFLGASMDVTDRKRAEEERQQAQTELAHVNRVTTMGQLAASIAHEVNQPIAAVVTNAEAALRCLSSQPPDLQETRLALGDIRKDGNRAGDVINRIRALIKKLPPRNDRLDINETILEVIALTRSEVLRNRVSLQTRLAKGLPQVEGDRVQLQQVLLNVLINAIEALGGVCEGSRDLLISTDNDESNGVLVTVRDSGPGLAPDSVERLFDAFYTTKSGGMGMGLSICRSIIEAHGGLMWAEAQVPGGAVFRFALPARGD